MPRVIIALERIIPPFQNQRKATMKKAVGIPAFVKFEFSNNYALFVVFFILFTPALMYAPVFCVFIHSRILRLCSIPHFCCPLIQRSCFPALPIFLFPQSNIPLSNTPTFLFHTFKFKNFKTFYLYCQSRNLKFPHHKKSNSYSYTI